jgi:hypothetical protein
VLTSEVFRLILSDDLLGGKATLRLSLLVDDAEDPRLCVLFAPPFVVFEGILDGRRV